MSTSGDLLHVVTADDLPPARIRLGRAIIWGSGLLLLATFALQTAQAIGWVDLGLTTWRPTLYAYLTWAVCLCWGQVLMRGEQGKRVLFVLPAVLFVVSLTVFPLLFGILIALSDWNLSSPTGGSSTGSTTSCRCGTTRSTGTRWATWRGIASPFVVEYAIAFGLALLLNAEIRARKFFRVAFLLPLMLSPVAVSWMIGKSMLEPRFGPLARLGRWLGWDSPSFFGDPLIAKLTIMAMDAWTYIPFMMIMLLAGLQSIPKEVQEAARVDGANGWRGFWEVTFPLMLPVSITAILIRIIFKLKLADIVITVTCGGPGGATDTVTSFIFREYRDRSNVGYGTLLAMVYLVVIVVAMTILMKLADRFARPQT